MKKLNVICLLLLIGIPIRTAAQLSGGEKRQQMDEICPKFPPGTAERAQENCDDDGLRNVSRNQSGGDIIPIDYLRGSDRRSRRTTSRATARPESSTGSALGTAALTCFAQTVFAETKRPEEMRLVAWVIRNRVDTRFRGETGYCDIVTDPYQFTPHNNGLPPSVANRRLDSPGRLWQTAVSIADEVARSASRDRPFSQDTRHFFSPQSMPDDRSEWPGWTRNPSAYGCTEVDVLYVSSGRFRFFRSCPSGI